MISIPANPGFALLFGALIAFATPRGLRGPVMLAASAACVALIFARDFGDYDRFAQIGLTVVLLRLDALSQVFGLACAIGAILMAMATSGRVNRHEDAAIFLLGGAATTAAFAGDLISFIAATELCGVAGAWVLLAGGGRAALPAGVRFLMWQGLGGLLLLTGVAFHLADGFDSSFTRLPADSWGGAFFLAGLAIKAAAPFVHVWLKDALSRASTVGAAALAIFATKVALYGLARGFSGEALLIGAGAAMALAGAVYAFAEDDIRRAFAYSLIAQTGLIVAAIGVGAPLSLAGAAAHAFTTTLSYGVLFLMLGAALDASGARRFSSIGGLGRAMPLTALFAVLAGLGAAAAPGLSGYVSETLTLHAISASGWRWPSLALSGAAAATAGLFALRLPAIFLGPARGAATRDAPFGILLAAAFGSFISLAIGAAPGWLYALLPPAPVSFHPYSGDRVGGHLQLIASAAAAVFLLRALGLAGRERSTRLLDIDALYEGPAAGVARWVGVVLLRIYGGVRAAVREVGARATSLAWSAAQASDRMHGAAAGWLALGGALALILAFYVIAA